MTIAAVFDRVEAGAGRTTLLYTFFAALSVGLFLISTHHGIGILPDSTRYMQISPVPYDAPLYSWLLQLGPLMGSGHDAVAYAAGLLLYVANTLLLVYIFNAAVRGRFYLVIMAGLLTVLAPQFVRAHIVAMSEPLFLFLILATILLLVRFIEEGNIRVLGLAGISLGLCMLTRFTAAPFALAFATLLLIFDARWSVTRRIRNIVSLGVVSGAIFTLWAVASKVMTGRATGRSFAFNGNPDDERWLSGVDSLSAFMMPTLVPAIIRYTLTLCLILGVAYLTWRACMRLARGGSVSRPDVLSAVFGLSAAWYLAFLIVAVNIEANLPLNGRYLFPVYIASIVVVFSALGERRHSWPQMVELAVVLLMIVVIAGHAIRTGIQTREAYQDGVGYQGPKWRNSPIILAVNRLPRDTQIFSNAPDAINYLTGRYAKMVPTKFERRTGVEDNDNPYAAQITTLRDTLLQGNAYVVFVDNVDWRFYLATEDDLRNDAALKPMQIQPDGRIYGP